MICHKKLQQLWYTIKSSYWIVPAAISLAAMGLACLTLAVDRAINFPMQPQYTWLVVNGAVAASTLTLVASSSITVIGVVLSITMVTLTLASGQYGPRLLRTFMTDLGTQLVVGLFSAAFLYALLILRLVHDGQTPLDVPQLSVATANALGLLSLGALVYFIHHVSVLIQASHVAAVVARDLEDTIKRVFPDTDHTRKTDDAGYDVGDATSSASQFACVTADHTGYVDTIGHESLLRLASKRELVIRLLHRPGDLIYAGDRLACIWPRERVDEKLILQVRGQFTISDRRTPQQDLECCINELTEVAVRALSPSINDPATAVACIDRLGAALAMLVARRLPDHIYRDSQRKVRIITRPFSVRSAIDAALHEIRQYAAQSASVHIRLLEAIERIARRVRRRSDAQALLRHAKMIYRSGSKLPERLDRRDVQRRFERCRKLLERRLELETHGPDAP